MIKQFDPSKNTNRLLEVINTSFLTVATEFEITKEGTPTHPAFMDAEVFLSGLKDKYVEFYGFEKNEAILGTVAVTKNQEGVYYIERLAVLPEHRHSGIGSKLMSFALDRIQKLGAEKCRIAIVNENMVLKRWYLKAGFVETEIKRYDHLPFLVCYMEISIPQKKQEPLNSL